MADFYNAVMTNGGAALLTAALAGTAKIQFTHMAAGDGQYTEEERDPAVLQQATTLKSLKQTTPVSRVDKPSTQSVKLTSVLTNEELLAGYYLREVGVYAQNALDTTPTPILYAISIAKVPDYIPAYNGLTPTTSTQIFYATVDNSANITLQVPSGAYALASDVQDLRDDVDEIHEITDGIKLRIGKTEQNVLALFIGLELDESIQIAGGGGNIAIEDFEDSDGFALQRGTYDSDNHRVYA